MTIDLTDRIELASGRFLNLRDPEPGEISIDDIAHGLAMTCRFSGQCNKFYSVAEHAMNVEARIAHTGGSVWMRLAGLHHDDAEGFVTDVPRPAKALLPDYAVLEESVLQACLAALGLEDLPVHCDQVKDADDWCLAQEAGQLMPSRGKYWRLRNEWDGRTDRTFGQLGPPDAVAHSYIARHYQLVHLAVEQGVFN